MEVTIEKGPGAAAAKVVLQPGEVLTAESGAMIAMSDNLDVQTTTHKKNSGGIMKAIKRAISGESIFMNHFTAGKDGGTVWLGTTLPGDMFVYQLNGDKLIVQAGSYVGSDNEVNVAFNWQGFKSLFSGESAFWLSVSGKGTVILNSFGAIYPIEVDGEYVVDTGHIVAFQETLNFSISTVSSSWLNSYFGGEGLVCRFKGKGTVWCQSHNDNAFGSALTPSLRPR
ncbi:MAG: TIGR00266 family protein [Cytophagales bacterium]|nr:TIGR00266 family protein [Cytophagales bacterium]